MLAAIQSASTMILRAFVITTVCFLAVAGPASAQLPPRPAPAPVPQPAPPPKPLKEGDDAKLLEQLEQMAKALDEQKFGHNASIIKELREAGLTADKSFNLWLDCMREVEYDQKGKTMAEFSEWKRKLTKEPNHDRDAEFQSEVQWLAIVLMDANARTEAARADTITAAMLFVDTLVDRTGRVDREKPDGRGRPDGRGVGGPGGGINESVLSSVFAKHYKLDATVSKRETGAYSPGDVDAIYDKMILPFFREAKQAANLMNAWQKRINQQTAMAEAQHFKEAKEQFVAEKLPVLRWGQAHELFTLGQEETAAQTMLSLIRANMSHRNASNWIEELKALVKKEKPPATQPVPENGNSSAKPTPVTPPPPDGAPAPKGPKEPPPGKP